MAEQKIEMVVRETVTETVAIDAILSEMVRDLVIEGLKEARQMLRFGLADQKLAIIRALLSGATRSLGKDFTSTESEAKVAVERLFTSMREIDEVVDAAPVAAIAPRTDDSD
jgi:hypothetical protein